jgi:hypothetical protein
MFLYGISTRTLSMMSERLIGCRIYAQEVSKSSKDLKVVFERWRERDLSKEPVKYLFVDEVRDGPLRRNHAREYGGVNSLKNRTICALIRKVADGFSFATLTDSRRY